MPDAATRAPDADAAADSGRRRISEAQRCSRLLDDDLYREVRATIIAAETRTCRIILSVVSQMEVFHSLHSEAIKANTRRVRRGVMVARHLRKRGDRRFILCVD